MEELIPAMEKALIDFRPEGEQRCARDHSRPRGIFLDDAGADPAGFGIKIVIYATNAERGFRRTWQHFSGRSGTGAPARSDGWKIDHRDAHCCSISCRDETSRVRRRKILAILADGRQAAATRSITTRQQFKKTPRLSPTREHQTLIRRRNSAKPSRRKRRCAMPSS